MGIFRQKLSLTKTHDFCAVKEPVLTVVMIHGIASDSSTFKRAIQYLEGTTSLKKVRFVTFDLLGWGESLKDDTRLEYNYSEQIEALHNSIKKLKVSTPLVLVGHSMGTFVVTRYANTYKKSVRELILISPPVYTEENLADPVFEKAIKLFEDAVGAKNPAVRVCKVRIGHAKSLGFRVHFSDKFINGAAGDVGNGVGCVISAVVDKPVPQILKRHLFTGIDGHARGIERYFACALRNGDDLTPVALFYGNEQRHDLGCAGGVPAHIWAF